MQRASSITGALHEGGLMVRFVVRSFGWRIERYLSSGYC
jgi:hypothetical protein